MREFDYWLHFIPAFFIILAFAMCGLQHLIESRIEAAELERRLKREKASMTLKKYFKKKEDKFDKVDYLGDMYKLIQKTVEEIKKQIAENKRRTDMEKKDNMNKMLKDKYSVMKDLMKSGGD
jgi:chromosome condensin MukBEF ATPase and DNA-binding subunit MukB